MRTLVNDDEVAAGFRLLDTSDEIARATKIDEVRA
jgi:hypothetical protein